VHVAQSAHAFRKRFQLLGLALLNGIEVRAYDDDRNLLHCRCLVRKCRIKFRREGGGGGG
jgi:hypothetical protein